MASADAEVSETAVSLFISFTISSTFNICKLCSVEDYELFLISSGIIQRMKNDSEGNRQGEMSVSSPA